MKISIITTIFLIIVFLAQGQQRVMYFHNGETNLPKQMDFSDIRNNPIYVTMDCTIKNCRKFVNTEYPALFYWKGAGSAFERIEPINYQAARQHLLAKQTGIVNRFRRYLEQISLFQTFIYASMFAGFLYYVFTLLFSPPHSAKKSHHKKKQ